MNRTLARSYPYVVFVASVGLGAEPLVWLVRSQASPAQAKMALARVLLLAVVVVWSSTSPRLRCARRSADLGLILLGAGLLFRVLGLALGVRHIGALALVSDLYAIGWLLDWPGRRRALSPLFVAAAACFCLPVDRPLYRLLGYPAQWLWQVVSGYRTSPELLVDCVIQSVFIGLIALSLRHRPMLGLPSWKKYRIPLAAGLAVGGAGFALLALFPPAPVDRGADMDPPRLPRRWGTQMLEPLPLTAQEREFFAAVGGNAAKGRYGETSLLVVRSNSPLRHLHSPTWCLAGLGHEIELIGYSALPYPAAHYRGRTPEGKVYEVESTFVSSKGERVAEISEVIWRWLGDRETTWRSVQAFRPVMLRPRRFQPLPPELVATR